jgi:DNA-binding transcriptional regulator YhcF (GntR family)
MTESLIDHTTEQPKYRQLVDGILADIGRGTLGLGQQLPSISELAGQQGVAKVTVAKAYELLRERGVVLARHGKGFYVATTDVHTPLNVLVLFDTLNAYKETLYDALKAALPPDAALSVFFHHYNLTLFESLIRNSIGRYTDYVIMPHFNEVISGVVGLIPPDKLLLIDQTIPDLPGDFSAVYQDFEQTIYDALLTVTDRLRHYNRLTLVLAKDHFQYIPTTLLTGYERFSSDSGVLCEIADNYRDELVQPGEAFLLFAERDLIALIKQVNRLGLTLGQDVGLIAYDDTPVKEILAGGITVISTDFGQMGQTAGQLLTDRKREKRANPGGLIRRQSL